MADCFVLIAGAGFKRLNTQRQRDEPRQHGFKIGLRLAGQRTTMHVGQFSHRLLQLGNLFVALGQFLRQIGQELRALRQEVATLAAAPHAAAAARAGGPGADIDTNVVHATDN